MNVESELKDIINRLYDIQDVSGPDLSKKIYEIILQCREAIGYRKAELDRVQSSRKPIKSFRDTSNEDTSNDYGFHWGSGTSEQDDYVYDKNGIAWYFGDYIDGNTGIEPYSSYIQAVKETIDTIHDSYEEDEIPDPEDYAYQLIDFAVETLPDPGKYIKEYEGFVKSSRKPIKSSYYSGNYDEDFDPADQGYTSYEGPETVCRCPFPDGTMEEQEFRDGWEMAARDNHDTDDLKNRRIANSHKPIKSSLEDRLVPYLEEFEEGYSNALVDDPMDHYAGVDTTNVRLDTFYEIFKNDHNLSDDDISKLEGAVLDIWHETEEENIEHDMGEMYGVPHGATSEEALKVFESRKPIKSGSMSGYFSGICDKCKQFTNVHYVGYNGRKLCMRCSRGR